MRGKIRGKDARMIGILGHDSALLRLYWAGDILGERCKRGRYEDGNMEVKNEERIFEGCLGM